MKNANGYGTAYKLSGNRRRPYIAVVSVGRDDSGKLLRQTLGYYKTQAEALKALSDYHSHPYDVAEKSAPLKEIWSAYTSYREDRKKPVTRQIRAIFNHCRPLHDKPLADIRPIDIQAIVDGLRDRPSTARRVRQFFRDLYKYAVVCGLPITDISGVIDIPAMPKSTMHKPFSPDEIEKLWAAKADFSCRLALLYIYTGCRPQELSEIRRVNVDLERRVMIGGMKTEAGRNREIPIAKKILPVIADMMARGTGEYLLIDDRNKHPAYNTLRDRWRYSGNPTVQAHRMHDGRHTCETLLDNAGVNKRTIQLIMGHAGRDIDESVYTHKTTEQLIEAIDLI